MADVALSAPPLPATPWDWLRVFGPGAVVASLTIGTGELIFSARGGAIFGYRILFVFALISVLKWGLVLASSRHMLLTGVHPYERMHDLPGPRGWLPLMLLFMGALCMPIWISFHSGVMGNLAAWITGTRGQFHGGVDYAWGAAILTGVLLLSASGGYARLERVQMWIVAALVLCATLTLLLYQPNWSELLAGLVPQRLSYPSWLPERYPQIARHSVWVETTRYVGVIGGAAFDYMAYTSWLREKRWGALPGRPTAAELEAIARDPRHRVRRWLTAPLVDASISFALVIAFSAVFVASGAIFLGPHEVVPDEDNFLTLQARFVTQIHPWLFPIYVAGAFFTMIGTLYGTIEIACSIADEIVRSFQPVWTPQQARKLKLAVVAWCAPIAFGILGWLFVRQANLAAPTTAAPQAAVVAAHGDAEATLVSTGSEPLPPAPSVAKPRLLLAVLTPVNLFTGVLCSGLVCFLNLWMDRRYLPPRLRMPGWLAALNLVAGGIFVALGIKGYWDHESRGYAVASLLVMLAAALIVATLYQSSAARQQVSLPQGSTS